MLSRFRLPHTSALWHSIAATVTVVVTATFSSAAAPTWWSEQGVLASNTSADDYAPVNQGQLRNIASAAAAAMDSYLSGGAGDNIHSLVNGWLPPTAQTNDYAPVNLGQLKNVAKPFYDRLIAYGWFNSYPWSNGPSPDDFAVANIGQVKNLFGFEIAVPSLGRSLWLKADVGVIADGTNAVSRWVDNSGNGNDAVQASASSRPIYVANVLNGQPIVRFDGSASFLNLPDFASSFAEGEIFVVVKSTASPSSVNSLWLLGDDSTWNPSGYPGNDGSGSIWEIFGTRNQKNTGKPSQPLDQFNLYNVSSKASQFITRINGREHYKTTSNTVFFPSSPNLGGAVYSGFRFKGDIAEVVMFNRVLSESERQSIGSYLDHKYRFIPAPSDAPTRLTAISLSPNQVSLSWINSVSNAIGFTDIERRSGTGAYARIASVANGMSYIDDSVSASTNYTYRVTARNDTGSSAPSGEVTVTTGSGGTSVPLSHIKLWLKADEGVSRDRANVWTDSSGNQNDASSTGSQPIVTENVVNGRPVVTFNGSSTVFSLPDFASGFAEGEVFVVLRCTATQPLVNSLWLLGDDSIWNPSGYPGDDGTGSIWEIFGTRNQKNTGKPSQPLNVFNLYNVSSKAGEFVTRINGREHFKTTSNTVFFPTAPNLGGAVYPGFHFKGDMAEVVIFDRTLTEDERDSVRLYLNQKYGFAGLPPPVPTQFQATVLNYSQVSLSWVSPISNSVTYYNVERRTGTGDYVTVATVTNGMSFIDSSAAPLTNYTYRILAWNDTGVAAPSAELSVSTGDGGVLIPQSDIQLWLKADEGVSRDKANVWTDSAGGHFDAIQVNPSLQPAVVENAINGKPVVRFDGVGTYFGFPDFLSNLTQGEVFVVVKSAGTQVDTNTLWMMGDDYIWGPQQYPANDGAIHETFGTRNGKVVGAPFDLLNQVNLYNISSRAGEFVVRMNGQDQYSTTSNIVFFPSAPLLGGGVYGRHRFGGDISELIIFKRVLSPQERERVEYYLADKYLLPSFDLNGDGLTTAQDLALGLNPRAVRDANFDGLFNGIAQQLGLNPSGSGYIWLPAPNNPPTSMNFTLTDPPGATLIH